MRLLAVLLAVLAATAAEAQIDAGPYIGLGYGVFQMEDDGEETGIGFSDTASSYRLFGGYNIHETLALELGFGKSSGFKEQLVGFDQVVGVIELDLEADYEVATLRVLAVAPFNGVDMFGGIGFYDADVRFTALFRSQFAGSITETLESKASGGTIIGGVQFHLDRLVIRGEYEWFDDDKGIATSALNVALILPLGR